MAILKGRRSSQQTAFVALVAAVAGFGLAALFWSLYSPAAQQSQPPQAQVADTSRDANVNAEARRTDDARRNDEAKSSEARSRGEGQEKGGSSIVDIIGFGQGAAFEPHEGWTVTVPRIILRLLLATALAAMLAFRPRRSAPLVQRNLYVAQTQILLAVVASALMMTVGDNAARAFGIFAAASLVRFRTNIRDPKEITVLLINLALGLATGVGRIDVAVVLALFVLPLLWLLERREDEQVFRAMELTVKTRNTEQTQDALQRIFRRQGIDGEVRQINPPDEAEPLGCVMYFVNMSLNTSTDAVNEEILAADPQNVESIEWEQQKSRDYIYQ
jgi:uncharacterized membrane protein YhiD involved in acid resistance